MDPVTLGMAKADARKRYGLRPNRIALMGDSIADNNDKTTGTAGTAGYTTFYDANNGFMHWALAYLNGRMTLTANTGVSGSRTDQWISSGQVQQIIAASPTWCVITAPTNDREQGTALTASQDNVLSIISQLHGAGIKVVLLGLMPESSGSVGTAFTQAKIDYTINWNYWIKQLAATMPDVLAVDPFRALADITTGGWFSMAANNVWTPDGLHPHAWSSARIGKLVADALRPHVPYLDPRPLTSMDKPTSGVETRNILLGAGMHGTAGNNGSDRGGVGTVVSNFAARSSDGANFAGTVTSSIVASTDMENSPWQQHVVTGSRTRLRIQQSGVSPASGLYTPGVTVARPQIEIDLGDDISQVRKLTLAMQCAMPDGSAETQWMYFNASEVFPTEYPLSKDAEGRYPVLTGPAMQIPAGTTGVTWYLDFEGMGTLRWRSPALRVSPTF